MVMPVFLTITYQDASAEKLTLPVEVWSTTDRWRAAVRTGGRRIDRVEIDAAGLLPDADRSNNFWKR
jgi:hypothetical protein